MVFIPIGFVSDHVETLYDIDIDALRMVRERGMEFHRAASLNERPGFIRALAEAVVEAAGEGR